jgi:hypothetical protein
MLLILVAAFVVMLGGGVHIMTMGGGIYAPKIKGLCNYKLKNHAYFRCTKPRGHEGDHSCSVGGP